MITTNRTFPPALGTGPPARFPYGALRRTVAAIATTAVLSACATGGSDAAPPGPHDPSIDPELALATFDSAWSRIHHSYYDPDFGGLDWPGVRDELRPRATTARTQRELRGVIGEMLDRIGDSHFGLIPQETARSLSSTDDAGDVGPPGDLGMDLRVVGDEIVVSRVRAGGPAADAGIRTGWAVDEIGGDPVERWFTAFRSLEDGSARGLADFQVAALAGARLQGPAGSVVELSLRDGADQRIDRRVGRVPMAGDPVRFGNLPTIFAEIEPTSVSTPEGCVGVIRFTAWMTTVVAPFSDAVDAFAGCAGIIVDLRGNIGGVAGMIMGVSGHFLAEQRPLGIMRTRESELRFVSIPRRVTRDGRPTAPYAGPVAILVDEMSASTSEFFAVGLQHAGRARLFGTTSSGQALPALMLRLPNGDVLLHAFADYTAPDGTRIEGRGAVPDQAVPLTRRDLLEGRDAPLEAALAWIGSAAHAGDTARD
jgi:carboxyl-terminal processing protease